MTDHANSWQAVAISSALRRKPLRVLHKGLPVVIFRSGKGIAALADRCPHRNVELSTGRVVNGEIECPYHGWRFAGGGTCTAIPGLVGEVPRYRVPAYSAMELDGAVFISEGKPETDPYVHCMAGQPIISRLVSSSTQSNLVDVAENILDATHTHYTHKGLLRGLSTKRNLVRVDVTGGQGWVEACYTGEDRQQGLVSRLLEGVRTKTIGRFRFPGIAELEFWGPGGLALATTFHLRQAAPDLVEGIGWLIGPKEGGLGYLKAMAFKPMFGIALRQDRRVLKSANSNGKLWDDIKPVIGPLDFLRRDIESILSGRMPSATNVGRTHYIEL